MRGYIHYNIRYEIAQKNSKLVLRIIKCINGEEETIAEKIIPNEQIELKTINKNQKSSFYYKCIGDKEKLLASGIDTIELSTEIADGFVGSTIGMYASSNGKETKNYADYRYFNYDSLDK